MESNHNPAFELEQTNLHFLPEDISQVVPTNSSVANLTSFKSTTATNVGSSSSSDTHSDHAHTSQSEASIDSDFDRKHPDQKSITDGDNSTPVVETPMVRLTWNNVYVTACPPSGVLGRKHVQNEKKILQGVTGIAEPGTLLAIMGSSGAGKSTMLNILTWRNLENLRIEGEILCNGINLGPDITSVSAYVQQDDLFMGELTVKEHLTFTARLRMKADLSDSARSKRVKEVMQMMGLTKCERTAIGTPGRSKTISGGEMKRLSFAAELLSSPSILFCDEPTSGLDSYLAKVIVECMQTITRQGCTVLCTIHQPSSEVFELFDRLLLLALGQVVYHGTADHAREYYERIGFPCPPNYNPADHYINAISVRPSDEVASKKQIADLQGKFANSNEKREIMKKIESLSNDDRQQENLLVMTDEAQKDRYRVNVFIQLKACINRAVKTTYRNPALTRVKVAQQLFTSIIIGCIFLRPNFLKPYQSFQAMTVVGSIFSIITNNTFSSVVGILNSFPSEIPIFRREHFNGMYSTFVYFTSKNVADLPTYIVLPLMYSIIVYFMMGLYPSPAKFFIFYGILVLMCNTCISFGYMISCMSPTISVALAIGPTVIIPLLLLGGFLIPPDQLPIWLFWLKYISWFFYTNEILQINQWTYVDKLGCNETNHADPCLYANGRDVLHDLDFRPDMMARDIGLMIALLIGYRVIALFVLYYRVRESTR